MSAHDNLSQHQFAHLAVAVERIKTGDLVRPMGSKQRFEQATGPSLLEVNHPFKHIDPDAPDLYTIQYAQRIGPHTPQGVRHEVYRRRG